MKTKIIFALLLILVVSCSKDKSDTRKMVGTWKRTLFDVETSTAVRVDTIQITKNQFILKDYFTQELKSKEYYLVNGEMFIVNDYDTAVFYYKIENKNYFTLGDWYLNGKEMRFNKIK